MGDDGRGIREKRKKKRKKRKDDKWQNGAMGVPVCSCQVPVSRCLKITYCGRLAMNGTTVTDCVAHPR
jgi:hypothetical protein